METWRKLVLVFAWLISVGRARRLLHDASHLQQVNTAKNSDSHSRRHATRGFKALAGALFTAAPSLPRVQLPRLERRSRIGGLPIAARARPPMTRIRMGADRRSEAEMKQRKVPLPRNEPSPINVYDRRKVIEAGIVASILMVPMAAEASFGSARGAVTSQPQVTNFNELEYEKLDPRKQVQIQSILRPGQLESLLDLLSKEKDKLQNSIESLLQTSEERKAKLTVLKQELNEKSQLVGRLTAQLENQERKTRQIKQQKQDLNDKLVTEREFEVSKAKQRDAERKKLKQLAFEELDELAKQKKLEEDLGTTTRELEDVKQRVETQERLIALAAEQEEELKNAKAELERTLRLQAQIKQREETLAKLDAQPDWFNYVAAFFASVISTSIMHPVDTLKTRQILADSGQAARDSSSTIETSLNSSIEDSPADPITPLPDQKSQNEKPKEWNVEELMSLYTGLPGALLKEGPPSALYLGVYEAVKTALLGNAFFAANPLLAYLIAGGVGETMGSVVRAPAEQLKTRVQSGLDDSIGTSFQRVILEEKGRENAVRSWTASIWRDVPFGAIQLAIFEGLKSYIINSPSSFLDIDVNALSTEVILGALGGGIGAFVSVPMDVITTRIMTQESSEECEIDETKCEEQLGFTGMTKRVWNEGGLSAVFTGARARVGYWAPAIGIFLSCYCSIRQQAVAQGIFDPIVEQMPWER